MSQEKLLNVKETFPESFAILESLNNELRLFLALPESPREPSKIKMLRSLNRLAKILATYQTDYKQDGWLGRALCIVPAIKKEIVNFAPNNGIPEITNLATYLLAKAYLKAMIVMRDYLNAKKFLHFQNVPEKLDTIITQLSEDLDKDTVITEQAKLFLEKLNNTNSSKKLESIPHTSDSQTERLYSQGMFSQQQKQFDKNLEDLENEAEQKNLFIKKQQQVLDQLSSQLTQLKTSSELNDLTNAFNVKNDLIEYFVSLSKLVSDSNNKKKRLEMLEFLERKYRFECFLNVLDIETDSIFESKDQKLLPIEMLKKLLSKDRIKKATDKKTFREYFLEKLSVKTTQLSTELDKVNTQIIEHYNQVTSLETECKKLTDQISELSNEAETLSKKITNNKSLKNFFSEEDDLRYYDRRVEDLRLVKKYIQEIKELTVEINKLKYDYESPQGSYVKINDKLIQIEQLENKIKALESGVEQTEKDALLKNLTDLSNRLLKDQKEVSIKHQEYLDRNELKLERIAIIKNRLAEKKIDGSFVEDERIRFSSHWKHKIDEYWSYRCKKYAFQDLLSCCFFSNEKERRSIFIRELKALLSSYHLSNHSILNNFIEVGLREFKTGMFSNKADDYKNLHGLLTKLKESMEIMEEEIPILRQYY